MEQKQPKQPSSNKSLNAAMCVGAVLLIVGAAMYALLLVRSAASWMTFTGALLFGICQALQGYHGTSLTIHRLRALQTTGAILLMLAGALMVQETFMLIPIPWQYHVQWVHNNWVVLLLAGAVIELYTTHRIQHEEEKEAKKT